MMRAELRERLVTLGVCNPKVDRRVAPDGKRDTITEWLERARLVRASERHDIQSSMRALEEYAQFGCLPDNGKRAGRLSGQE